MSVADLTTLQRLMGSAIVQPLTPRYRMQRRWTDGRPMTEVANSFITPNDHLSSFERLEIYNRQYWFRILDCFYDDYPGLRAVLGERRFMKLARAYLAEHPSRSFTLRNLGSRLEGFLRKNPQWVQLREELALDMIRLEWAHIVAFDSEAKPPITADELLGRNPSKVRLALQPHITLLELNHPVDDLLIEVKQRDGLRSEASNAVDTQRRRAASAVRKVRREHVFLGVHRMRLSVYYRRLAEIEFQVLRALQRGDSVQAACTKAMRWHSGTEEQFAALVKDWFHTWGTLGWLCAR